MNDEDLRKQAWDFFETQAGHRLTSFNYYIALSSLLSGGLAASFRDDVRIPFVGLLLGMLLVLFAFVFWKLDGRNRELIRSAEEALRFFESQASSAPEHGTPHVTTRFLREEHDTRARRAANSWRVWRNHYTYSDCFNVVFATFALVGLVGAACSIWLTWAR